MKVAIILGTLHSYLGPWICFIWGPEKGEYGSKAHFLEGSKNTTLKLKIELNLLSLKYFLNDISKFNLTCYSYYLPWNINDENKIVHLTFPI